MLMSWSMEVQAVEQRCYLWTVLFFCGKLETDEADMSVYTLAKFIQV